MAKPLKPEIHVEKNVTVIQLGPGYETLNEHLMDDLREVLMESVCKADPPVVLVDLSHTAFFGSSFIEILVQMWKQISVREGGSFALCGLNENCLEVLQVTHLISLWQVFDTQQAAVNALTGE